MAEVTTEKPINLYQLGLEIGGNPSFHMKDLGTSRVLKASALEQAALEAAVAAHTADPGIFAPPQPDQNEERRTLREQAAAAVADDDTYLALATPTNAQIAAQVKRLTQHDRHIIKRLVQID